MLGRLTTSISGRHIDRLGRWSYRTNSGIPPSPVAGSTTKILEADHLCALPGTADYSRYVLVPDCPSTVLHLSVRLWPASLNSRRPCTWQLVAREDRTIKY